MSKYNDLLKQLSEKIKASDEVINFDIEELRKKLAAANNERNE